MSALLPSCWTSQKTKGLGWQLVTVAGEHTKAVKTPRARGTSVVVDFSAVGFRESKRYVPDVWPLLQEGGWPLQFFGPFAEQTVRAFRETWRAQNVSEQRAREKGRAPRFGSRSFLCTKFFGEYGGVIFLPHLDP